MYTQFCLVSMFSLCRYFIYKMSCLVLLFYFTHYCSWYCAHALLFIILCIVNHSRLKSFIVFVDRSVTTKLFQWNSLCNRLWSYNSTIQPWMFPVNYNLALQPRNFSTLNGLQYTALKPYFKEFYWDIPWDVCSDL